MKHNIDMIKLEDNHGYSHSDFMYFSSELSSRGFGLKQHDCYLGNFKLGTMLEIKNGRYITTWSDKSYLNTTTALTYLVKLLNG